MLGFFSLTLCLQRRRLLSSAYKGTSPLRVYDLLQRRRTGEGQNDLPASIVSSDSFRLNYLICQGTIFGGSVS